MKHRAAYWSLLSIVAVTGCKTQPENTIKPDAPLSAETRFAAGQLAENRGDTTAAIEQYETARKLSPNAPMPLQRLGVLYTATKKFDKAEAAWVDYIKVTKGSAAAYCNLGFTQELAQRPADAEAAYKAAIAQDPTNETARVDYGLMLARQGRFDAATTQLQVVLTPAEAHYDIASVLQSQGKTEAAKSQYQQALQLDPDMSDAKLRLADLN